MKNAIGLLLLGLLLRYGAADVSHLKQTGRDQYLPPPIQNLPIEQDYNGIDSQQHSGHNNANRGYLPPYQDQQQLHNNQHDHHHDQDHEYDDQQYDNPHDHGNHNDQQHDHHHNNQHDHHQNQQQYQDPYDPSVQVSYHNDYAINHPNNHDQSHNGHVHDDDSHGHHNDHDDHVEIDQQQLEPIFPSRFPIQAYLPPTAGTQVGPSRGESHSISLVHYHGNSVPVSSPAPFSLPQGSPTPLDLVTKPQPFSAPDNGYHYPRPTQPTELLYPNEVAHHGGQDVSNGHHHPQQGYLPPSQPHDSHLNHGSPAQENHDHTGVSNGHSHHEPEEDYLPPSQPSHGHSHQQPQQDFLPPNQLNSHSNHLNPQQGTGVSNGHSHQQPQQDYLPPNQVNSHSNHLNPQQGTGVSNGHSHQQPQQDYLPPNQVNSHSNHLNLQQGTGVSNEHSHQEPHQDYLPPNQLNSHSNDLNSQQGTGVSNGHSHQEPHQDYLPPNQLNSHSNHLNSQQGTGVSHGHSHQEPHQDYLPPNQLNSHSNHLNPQQGTVASNGHSHQEPHQDYLPPNQLSTHSNHLNPQQHSHQEPHQDYVPPNQLNHGNTHSNHLGPQQDYLPPTQSSHIRQSNPTEHHHSGHVHQAPLQDYLPPNQQNVGNSGNTHQAPLPEYQSQSYSTQANLGGSILSNQHSGHTLQQPQQDYIPPTQSNQIHLGVANAQLNSGHHVPQQNVHLSHLNNIVTNVYDNSGQSNQNLQQDYLPPLSSTSVPKSSNGLHIVPSQQLGLLTEKPKSQLTVRGHVNVPLPIPQVGYFFIPGVVSALPSLAQQNAAGLRPAINIPAIISPQQPTIVRTQRISSPEYTRTFLLPKISQPIQQKTSQILSITPSIETLQNGMSPEYVLSHQAVTGRQVLLSPQQNSVQLEQSTLLHTTVPQQNLQNLGQTLLGGLGSLPVQQNNHQTLLSFPRNLKQGPGYLPPINQQQQQLILNQGNGAVNQNVIRPDKLSNKGLSLQNIVRSEVPGVRNQQQQISQPLSGNSYKASGYLPPANEHHSHQPQNHNHHHGQPQDHHHHNTNVGGGYLPPENHNHVTSLQTYMNGVHPSDRYGASQYHHPPPNEKGNPPPPVATSSPMFSKPSAIRSYAPGMAYRVSTNTPFNTFTPATYLPPVEKSHPPQDHEESTSSIGFELNEEAKRNLANIMPKDNTVFPLEELLNLQDNDEIDMHQLMAQLRGRIRTVQITNDHSNSVKNIKVLETADHAGVKTIKILGRSNEDPMGEHKVVRIISKGPHPEDLIQTVKIFSDHKEVSLPTQNAYLPPPKAKEAYVRVLRHSQDSHRSH